MPEINNIKYKSKYIAIISIMIVSAGIFFYYNFSARSASYSFFQTDWSGGVSVTTATHPGDATGWDKYASADSVVTNGTPGQLTLSTTTASWVQTSTADFAAGVFSRALATANKIVLVKPSGVACSSGAECLSGYCGVSGVCSVCEGFTYSGKAYGVVLINGQCWMSQNLDVGTYTATVNTGSVHSDVSNNGVIQKYCYSNNTSNCTTYGGLYDWSEMMGYSTTAGVQGICAPGWHIPTDAEWFALENFLNTTTCSASRVNVWGCSPAGTSLQINGSADFDAPLGGVRNTTGGTMNAPSRGYFWTSTVDGSNAWMRQLYSSDGGINRDTWSRQNGLSVRCIKS